MAHLGSVKDLKTIQKITHDNQIDAGGPHAWSADNDNTKDIRNDSNDPNTNKQTAIYQKIK